MDAPRRERRHHRKPAAAAAARAGYGDVFGGPPRFGAAGPPPLDYAEVFGGLSSACSIPYLDLPPVAVGGGDDDGGFFPGRGRGRGGGAGDYGEIFGRFGFADFAAPYEELFGRKERGAPAPAPYEELFGRGGGKERDAPTTPPYEELFGRGIGNKRDAPPAPAAEEEGIASSSGSSSRSSVNNESRRLDAEQSPLHQHFKEHESSPMCFPPESQEFVMSYYKTTQAKPNDLIEMTTCTVHPSVDYVVGSSHFSHTPATNHVSKMDNGVMANGDRKKKSPSTSVTANVRSPEIDFSFDQKQHVPECPPLSENISANVRSPEVDFSFDQKQHLPECPPLSENVSANVRTPEIDFSFDQKQHVPECPPLSENVSANVRSPEIDFSFDQKQHVPECPPLSNNVSANDSNQKSDIRATPSNGKPSADYAFMRVSNVNMQTQPKVPLQPLGQQPKVLNKKESAAKRDVHLANHSGTPVSVHVTSSTVGPQAEKRADAALSNTEANPSSAAAAMKEAMDYAEARLRAAKELMERKGDSFKIRKKPSHHRSTRSVDIKAPVEVYTFEANMSLKNPAKVGNRSENFVFDNHQEVGAVRSNHSDDSRKMVLPLEKPQQMMRTCTMPSKLEKLGNWRSGDEFFELTGDDQKCQSDTARGEQHNCGRSKPVTEPSKGKKGKIEVAAQDSDLGRYEKPWVVNDSSDLEVKHESRKEDNRVQMEKGEDRVSTTLEASTENVAHKGIDSSHFEELLTAGNTKGSHDDGSIALPFVSKISPELDFIKDVPSSCSASSSVNCASDLKHLGMSSVAGTSKQPENSEGGLEVRCDDEMQCTSGSSKTLQEPPEVADLCNSQASQIKSLILEELEGSDIMQASPRVQSTSELEAETYGREKFSFIGESCLHNENDKMIDVPCESLISEVEKVETEVELHPYAHSEESVPDQDVKCTEESNITSQTYNPVVSSMLNLFEVASKLIKRDVDEEIQGSLGPSEVENRTEEGTDRPVYYCEGKQVEETPSENTEKTDTDEESAHVNQEDQTTSDTNKGKTEEESAHLNQEDETASASDINKGKAEEESADVNQEDETTSASDTNNRKIDVDAQGNTTVDEVDSVITSGDEATIKSANYCPTGAINTKDEPAFCPDMSTDVQHLTQNGEFATSHASNENDPGVDKTKEVCNEAERELPTETSTTSEEERTSVKAVQEHRYPHLEKSDSVSTSAERPFLVSDEVSRKETPEAHRTKERGSITKTEKGRQKDGEASQRLEEAKERQKILAKQREKAEDSERKKLEEQEREREREKDKLAVERATREAHERAFNNAREMAEKMALERIAAARQRASAEARLKEERANAEARLKAERAAVERATVEARERAIKKAKADKAAAEARERREQIRSSSKDIRQDTQFQRATSSGSVRNPDSSSKVVGAESGLRHKARIERHQRTTERVSKALAEKNMRDLMVQREQAEKQRLADFLDPEVKRWSNGKEGNLRALLSTLQYILGADSGWQPVPLTDLITAAAVKKAYRKATLCVHPDKLQQRGATIRQKYICEKVFDLLKDAWNKFTSEER